MESQVKHANFIQDGEEYVISCRVFVSPAAEDTIAGHAGAGLKEVVCIVDIERKDKRKNPYGCLN